MNISIDYTLLKKNLVFLQILFHTNSFYLCIYTDLESFPSSKKDHNGVLCVPVIVILASQLFPTLDVTSKERYQNC